MPFSQNYLSHLSKCETKIGMRRKKRMASILSNAQLIPAHSTMPCHLHIKHNVLYSTKLVVEISIATSSRQHCWQLLATHLHLLLPFNRHYTYKCINHNKWSVAIDNKHNKWCPNT